MTAVLVPVPNSVLLVASAAEPGSVPSLDSPGASGEEVAVDRAVASVHILQASPHTSWDCILRPPAEAVVPSYPAVPPGSIAAVRGWPPSSVPALPIARSMWEEWIGSLGSLFVLLGGTRRGRAMGERVLAP
jgi:hypothetical protein